MKEPTPPHNADARRDAPTIRGVNELGARGALYLLALVRAHQSRSRLAPTTGGSSKVLSVLDALGVVRAEQHIAASSNVLPWDRLPWAYTWNEVPFSGLEDQLLEFLDGVRSKQDYADTWLRVWCELLQQEVHAYLGHQLRIHQFGDFLLEELGRVLGPNEGRYSLGHWRYACWAAVRSVASVSLQHPGNAEILKFTLANELPKRLRLAEDSPAGKLIFSPSRSFPPSCLSEAFYSVSTALADDYWRLPPRLDPLMPRARDCR